MDGVFALSVADEVEKYGAYLAVASFIGLAALSILYFSQARELKRLREWAGRAPERAAELQDRVVAEASAAARRVSAPPVARQAPPKPPVAVPAAVGAPAAPAAPAAPGAPGPPAEPGAGNGVAAKPDGEGAADAAPEPAAKPAAEPETDGVVKQTTDSEPKSSPPEAETPAAPATPAPPMAPSTAAARDAAAVPPDLGETTEFDISETDPVEAPPPLPPRRSVPARTGAAPLRSSSSSASPRRPGAIAPAAAKQGRSPWPVVAGVVLALAAGVFGATQLLGDDEQPLPNQPAPADTADETTTEPGDSSAGTTTTSKTERGDITVAVLNGTTTPGLAGKVADRVEKAGFVRGTTGNNADQQRAASQVFFADGRQAAAREVAKLLGIGDVLPLDVNTRGLAGEDAAVVVVVGSDQSTQ